MGARFLWGPSGQLPNLPPPPISGIEGKESQTSMSIQWMQQNIYGGSLFVGPLGALCPICPTPLYPALRGRKVRHQWAFSECSKTFMGARFLWGPSGQLPNLPPPPPLYPALRGRKVRHQWAFSGMQQNIYWGSLFVGPLGACSCPICPPPYIRLWGEGKSDINEHSVNAAKHLWGLAFCGAPRGTLPNLPPPPNPALHEGKKSQTSVNAAKSEKENSKHWISCSQQYIFHSVTDLFLWSLVSHDNTTCYRTNFEISPVRSNAVR